MQNKVKIGSLVRFLFAPNTICMVVDYAYINKTSPKLKKWLKLIKTLGDKWFGADGDYFLVLEIYNENKIRYWISHPANVAFVQ